MTVARFEEYQSKVGKEKQSVLEYIFHGWFMIYLSLCKKERSIDSSTLSSSFIFSKRWSFQLLFLSLLPFEHSYRQALVRPLKEFWLTVLFVYAFGQRWKGSSACVVKKHRTASRSMLLPSNITSKNGKMFAQWLSLCLFVLMITVFVLLPWVKVSKNNSVFKGKHCSASDVW